MERTRKQTYYFCVNFANAVDVDTVYRAYSSWLNPRAGPECINFNLALTVHMLWMFLSPGNRKIVVLSRLDAEVTVRDSFLTYYGIVYAKIDAEIRI